MQGQVVVPEGDWTRLNQVLGRLQQASLLLNGLRLDVSRDVVPTTAPGIGDPNLVIVNVASVYTLYIWDGSVWTAVGLQV